MYTPGETNLSIGIARVKGKTRYIGDWNRLSGERMTGLPSGGGKEALKPTLKEG